jgi:tRNA A22 N-methylase
LQHLTINVLQEEFQSIVKYLLMNNKHTRHLRSLYIQNTGDIWTEKLLNAISEVRQQDEVSVEADGYYKCYLWW